MIDREHGMAFYQVHGLVYTSVDDCRSSLECNSFRMPVMEAALKLAIDLGHKTRVKIIQAAINKKIKKKGDSMTEKEWLEKAAVWDVRASAAYLENDETQGEYCEAKAAACRTAAVYAPIEDGQL